MTSIVTPVDRWSTLYEESNPGNLMTISDSVHRDELKSLLRDCHYLFVLQFPQWVFVFTLNSHGNHCHLRMYTLTIASAAGAANATQLGMLGAAPCVNNRVIWYIRPCVKHGGSIRPFLSGRVANRPWYRFRQCANTNCIRLKCQKTNNTKISRKSAQI